MDAVGVLDCRIEEEIESNFFTLSLWGKAVFNYVLEEMVACSCFEKVYLLTSSIQIEKMVSNRCVEVVREIPFFETSKICCVVYGGAVFLSRKTIEKVISTYKNGIVVSAREVYVHSLNSNPNYLPVKKTKMQLVNAFAVYKNDIDVKYFGMFEIDHKEGLVINSMDDFELALVFKKKEISKEILRQNICKRIEEKKEILKSTKNRPSICLVGHSQIDNWVCETLAGMVVRNCGISGISSFEYNQYILDEELLNCESDCFILMHGTNDIVSDYSDEEIINSIKQTIDYINMHNRKGKIYLIAIAHVNGRLDRSNERITKLNNKIRSAFKENCNWIDLKEMDDEFGNLDLNNTSDGLHFSEQGYQKLKEIVEINLLRGEDEKNSDYTGSIRL